MSHENDTLALPTRKRAPDFKTELKVLAVLAVFILVLEIISRIIAPHLDSAAKHIHEFPQLAKELKTKPNDAPKVMFYGNSLMMHGLDHPTMQQEFDDKQLLHTAKVTPVGTNIVDWTYIYQQYFEAQETHPNILIVGGVKHHFADSESLRERRLARHFVATKDLPQVWKEDLDSDLHRSTQATFAHFSSLMGDQPEHHLGILEYLFDSYKPGLRKNNELVKAMHAKKAKPKQAAKPLTVNRIKRLIALAKKHNVEIWFVPMPQPEHYNIPQLAIDTIKQSGMRWVDARNIEGMTPKDFSDGYHLGETGNKKFTNWMKEKLHAHLKDSEK